MDNNKLINLEEARNILKFAKRIYRALDGVTVEYGNIFAYYPNELRITIPEEFHDTDLGMSILSHVNREFNATFEYNLREMSIQAFCHEMGHHMDYEGKIFTNRIYDYMEADDYNRGLFQEACKEFANKVNDFYDKLDEYNMDPEDNDELGFELEMKQIELEKEDEALDILYRLIPTEYAADEFSARFFMTYLKPYKKCNYNVL